MLSPPPPPLPVSLQGTQTAVAVAGPFYANAVKRSPLVRLMDEASNQLCPRNEELDGVNMGAGATQTPVCGIEGGRKKLSQEGELMVQVNCW